MNKGLVLGIGAILSSFCLSLLAPVDNAEAGWRHRRCGGWRCQGVRFVCNGCWGGCYGCMGGCHGCMGCAGPVMVHPGGSANGMQASPAPAPQPAPGAGQQAPATPQQPPPAPAPEA